MKDLADQKKDIATEPERRQYIQDLLSDMEATEDSMAVVAGTILQIGKQVLSFRFGPKPSLQSVRMVGSQSIVELIWEGRNHALHWEENSPRPAVQNMLQRLQQDKEFEPVPNSNNAFGILAALGWY